MNKSLSLLCFLFIWLLSMPNSFAQSVAVGDIDILSGVSQDQTQPTSVCQDSTIVVRYELKKSFSVSTSFEYQLASPANFWGSSINLRLIDLYTDFPNNVKATTSVDTFQGNALGVLWAKLAIPASAPVFGNTFRIVNLDASGNINDDIATPEIDGASDTGYVNINRTPTIAEIDSAAHISNGIRDTVYSNPYTPVNDLGFCEGDTIYLRVKGNGSSLQWYNGSSPISGETDDTLMVSSPGVYSAEVLEGGCSIFTNDTIINFMSTPSDVSFNTDPNLTSRAFQIDNPSQGNGSPDDSIQMCITETAALRGPTNPPMGISFSYQWLADTTLDGVDNQHVLPADTNLNIVIDSSKTLRRKEKFWLVVNDGFCTDTSAPYFVFVDTIPDVQIGNVNFPSQNSFLDLSPTVCMRDSVLLSSIPPSPTTQLKYQWQWFDPNLNTWVNLVDDTLATLQLDTSFSDINFSPFSAGSVLKSFRIRVNNFTPFKKRASCTYFTDSITVRWFPEYEIDLAPNQLNRVVDVSNFGIDDSVNICANDTVLLRGPASPDPFALPYDYEWLTDSINQAGQRVLYSLGSFQRVDTITTSGRYYVRINDGICVDTSRPMRVFVDTLPSTQVVDVPFSPGSTTDVNLCLRDSLQITAIDTVSGWDYQWQQYNNNTQTWVDLTNDTLPSFLVDTTEFFFDTTGYRLVINYLNRFGVRTCDFVTDSFSVFFFEPPTLTFNPGTSVGVCQGDSVLLVADGTFNSVEWNNGTQIGTSIYVKDTGLVPVRAIGANGCFTRDTVEVFPITVSANAGPDQTTVSGESVTLNGSGGRQYRWWASEPIEFSDFLSSTVTVRKVLDDNVSADTVTIFLEVTNGEGCTGVDQMNLIIRNGRPDSLLLQEKAYNVFTPNGDGLNDIWDISEIVDGDACEIMILNRWGSTVYDDPNFNGQWTGVDNGGNELPDGTYYYILSCGDEVRLKNSLTIMRNR